MLSWEFPPRIIGGISTHVYHLSKVLVSRDASVHVITCDFPNAPSEEVVNGAQVSRVDCGQVPQSNFLLWVYHLNSQLIERGKEILEGEKFDVLHAHDWLVGRAAIELKTRYDLPLVTTIHATEMGRGGAIDNSYGKRVHAAELRLAEASERVICCSNYMVHHLHNTLGLSSDRIHVIPNGVDVSRFYDGEALESHDGAPSDGDDRTILFVGRLVKEKGVSTLLEAYKDIHQQNGINTRLVVVGDGPIREDLAKETLRYGLGGNVKFTGSVDEQTLVSLYKSSDVIVVPSLYEPFGIVALEGMAARKPVVVSDVGGLSEIVEDGVTGVKVPAGNPKLLAQALLRVLGDRPFVDQLKENAYGFVKDQYRWDSVAEETLSVYNLALVQPRVQTNTVEDEDFLGEQDLLHYLLAIGSTKEETAKSARQIATAVGASEVPVKLILGTQVSRGYVSTVFGPGVEDVRYYLSETGIIKVCSDLS